MGRPYKDLQGDDTGRIVEHPIGTRASPRTAEWWQSQRLAFAESTIDRRPSASKKSTLASGWDRPVAATSGARVEPHRLRAAREEAHQVSCGISEQVARPATAAEPEYSVRGAGDRDGREDPGHPKELASADRRRSKGECVGST